MSEQIQTTLLDQIHVVNNETKVLIWLSNNLRVTANVGKTLISYLPVRLFH